MEWVLRSSQIHSTFSNLGFLHADGYHVNENCNAALETILHSILLEDKYLRTYRRSISFGQNIKKDLIPLLLHAKEDVTIELLTKILVNLTIPIECLLSVEVISKSDFGRHTIFEINNLLTSTKTAFADHRVTKVILDFLKKNGDFDQKAKLSDQQCTNISNCLLLLRNILHIPEESSVQSPNCIGHNVQNQILWNIFSQSIDKVLIKLMIIPDTSKWAVTMVQLIALLYKDQHVVTLHKLLNLWLEASLSESSEDNESNTSPPDRGSEDSSPMFTSDPTSDSSDTGGSGKSNDEPSSDNKGWDSSEMNTSDANESFETHIGRESDESRNNDHIMKSDNDRILSCSSRMQLEIRNVQQLPSNNCERKIIISENSDCGYGTQIENQESISTSSNDDEPAKKPVHQKPHNPKQRINTKARSGINMQERKRKKIVKRSKSSIINVQGLTHKTPTDDDIANILKEFTVDFLLKGYSSLVQTLHNQILTNMQLEIDTSHFFWLVTYFLKFATQIELDLEHVHSVLSYDIISYLTSEGVNLCEQFELAIKLDGNDLKPSIRRLHLVVTAIREIIQAIEVYKKFAHMCKDDQEALVTLQIQMCETEELRSLLVLLLRHYNPKYHAKQYLQDLVVTNHILLTFLDSVVKQPQYSGINLVQHVRQFATPKLMYQYGLLLEDYGSNGEFVNDCVFTMMHHVGGELDSLITLYQPKILKTFTSILKSEFEICDDWSDLIEYAINTFTKKPQSLQSIDNCREYLANLDDGQILSKLPITSAPEGKLDVVAVEAEKEPIASDTSQTPKEKWSDDELSSLSWNYMQCNSLPDVVGEIVKLFKDDGIFKTRDSIIQQLFKQNVITKDVFEKLLKGENDRNSQAVEVSKEVRDNEIHKLCEQLAEDDKVEFLDWVQSVVLETCYAKICLEKRSREAEREEPFTKIGVKWIDQDKKLEDNKILSPLAYHSLISKQSVPLVPWNCKQASICKDLTFLELLNKLGFHMPVDSGKVFIRIPHFWTTDFLYDVAEKISPIDKCKLKFSISDIRGKYTNKDSKHIGSLIVSADVTKNITFIETTENFYKIHKQKLLATMMNYTPMPGSSFNSEMGDVNKQNWLEVVQKSQEYKITLNLDSKVREEEKSEQSDVEMKAPATDRLSAPSIMLPYIPAQSRPTTTSSSFVMSTIMSVQQETPYHKQAVEIECYNNSVCESTSIASNMTQMYVTDEDENTEVLLPINKKINPLT